MIHSPHFDQRLKYLVQIGHTSVEVEGIDRADAIRQARRRLSAELPRMWDLIHQADERRFRVSPLLPERDRMKVQLPPTTS